MIPAPSDQSHPLHFNGERLRELRELQGLDVAVLARRLALSAAQLRQLEQNQTTLFYSDAIRLAAARRVSEYLGEPLVLLEPAMAQVVLSARPPDPEPETIQPAQASYPMAEARGAWSVAASTPVADRESMLPDSLAGRASESDIVSASLPAPSFSRPGLRGWSGALLGAVAVAAVVLGGELNHFRQTPGTGNLVRAPAAEEPVASGPAGPPAGAPPLNPALPLAAADEAPMTLAAVSAEPAPVAPPARGEAACGSFVGPASSFSPARAMKDGSLVYVVGAPDQVVCLKDAEGKVTRHVFKSAQGQSFYGTAPWVVESEQLAALQIFFQGARVRWAESDSTRLRLVAAEPS